MERDAKETNWREIKAIIRLLVLSGSLRRRHQNLADLWSQNCFDIEILYTTMSLWRGFYSSYVVYDLTTFTTDTIRRAIENLLLFAKYLTFVANCEKYYKLSMFNTVDEKLVPLRGKWPFRQHITNKPARYCIKVDATILQYCILCISRCQNNVHEENICKISTRRCSWKVK